MIKHFAFLASLLIFSTSGSVLAEPASPVNVSNTADKLLIARRSRARKSTPNKKSTSSTRHWATGLKIPYKSWLPRNKPSRVLLCVHGLGFSSKSYTRFGRYMAARGIAVYAIDVRGFGQWRRVEGHDTVDFEACINDLETALRTIRSNIPGAKVYLVGESMGGAIAISVTSRYPELVDGLISSVPSGERYGDLKEKIIVGAHYIENKNEPMDISSEVIDKATSNKALQESLKEDPTIRMDLTPEELKQFNAFMKDNEDYAALVEKTPVLMMAGFEDRLVKPKGTIELFNEVTNLDKILVVIGDGEHLILEEAEFKNETAGIVYNWLRYH